MQNKINSGFSFKSLYTGRFLQNELKENTSKQFIRHVNSIKRVIRKNNLHNKENVDIILQYQKEEGFYGVISSKNQGTPNNPAYRCSIDGTKSGIDKFRQWVEAWDEAYSPESINHFKELMNLVKNGYKK